MDSGSVLPSELSGRPVLVMRVPNLTDQAREALRDYVVESLSLGVLVIGPGFNYSLERFPQLGGVLCRGEQPEGMEEPEEGPEEGEPQPEELIREHGVFQPVLNGRKAGEKQRILARLKAYRKAHGLGCLEEVAREARGEVTSGLLRDMLIGAASPGIAQWRQVKTALDKLERAGEVSGE